MKVRNSLFALLSFLLVITLFLTACAQNSEKVAQPINDNQKETTKENNSKEDVAKEEIIEINVNNIVSSTSHVAKNAFEPWKKLVEEKTNGRVKVNLFHGATLGGPTSVWQDINGGLYDVSIALPTYFYDTELFPYTIGMLPFAIPDPETGRKVMTKFSEKYGEKAIADSNAVIMSALSTDGYDLFSVKPITSSEDIKKLRMRTSGKADLDIAKAWGATPVSIDLSQLYEAMEKNMLDVSHYTPLGSIGLKLYEVAPVLTKVGMYSGVVTLVMNKDFYNNLPDDLKKVFDDELFPAIGDLLSGSYLKESETAYKVYEEKGEVNTLPEKEMEKLKAATKGIWNEWVVSANQKGYPGEQMMNDFKEMLSEEGVELPF